MIYSTVKFNLNYFLMEMHATAANIQKDKPTNFHYLNEKFSFTSVYEIIALAKILISLPNNLEFSQNQLVYDIKLLTDHVNNGGKVNGATKTFFRAFFGQSLPRIQAPTLSKQSVEDLLNFLHEFAPKKSYSFFEELHKNDPYRKPQPADTILLDITALYAQVIKEIETHLESITDALGYRLYNLGSYLAPNSYNKLLTFHRNLNILITLINEDRFADPQKANSVISKSLGSLQAHSKHVVTTLQKFQPEIMKVECRTIHEFLARHSVDVFDVSDLDSTKSPKVLLSMRNQLNNLSIDLFFDLIMQHRASGSLENWVAAMINNPTITLEAVTFCHQFCEEKEHILKMRLLQSFLTELCFKYPPTQNLDTDELIRLIQAIFLLASSPQFLLNILLLEIDTITYAPNPDLTNSDYTLEEIAAGKGIQFYNFLNLTNAFTNFCDGTISKEEEEINLLSEKATLLSKKLNLNFDQKSKSKSEWEQCLLKEMQKFENDLSERILSSSQEYAWQVALTQNPKFCQEAKNWANRFCAEPNGIYKLNQHRADFKRLQETYAPETLYQEDLQRPFLKALILSAQHPSVLTEFALIDEKSIGWKVCEGFIADVPVNATLRLQDYKLFQKISF